MFHNLQQYVGFNLKKNLGVHIGNYITHIFIIVLLAFIHIFRLTIKKTHSKHSVSCMKIVCVKSMKNYIPVEIKRFLRAAGVIDVILCKEIPRYLKEVYLTLYLS